MPFYYIESTKGYEACGYTLHPLTRGWGVFPKLNREEEIWILQSVNKEYTNYTKCLVD